MSWASILAQYQKEFEAAEVTTFEELPDGVYKVRIEAVRLKTSKEKGLPMLEWEFVVADGKYEGRHEWKYSLITSERIRFLKFDLYAAGLHLKNLADLEKELPKLLDRLVEIKIETKKKDGKEFRNIYIQKPIEEEPKSKAEPMGFDDGDLPF